MSLKSLAELVNSCDMEMYFFVKSSAFKIDIHEKYVFLHMYLDILIPKMHVEIFLKLFF